MFLLWIGLAGLLLYLARQYVHSFVRFVWSDGAVLLSCCLVALAITAAALNKHGIHPLSIPGMLFMGLVGFMVGVLILRWGETHP